MTSERPSLAGAFVAPEAKRRYVRRLFATIADRYDLITVLLSFGRDRAWKQRLVELSGARAGRRLLDLACGTGDIAFAAADRGAAAIGLDITPRMLQLAKRKPGAARVPFVVGDMAALPVADAAFQIVTTGYGLRNVPDLPRAIAEISRVLAPGGTFCSLDFDRPEARMTAVHLPDLPDNRGQRARLDPARRSRHLPLHSGVHQALSRCAWRRRAPGRGGTR